MKDRSVIDSYNPSKIHDWNFEKNLDIDILEEPDNSTKVVSWSCSYCFTDYENSINSYSSYGCPICGQDRLFKFLNKRYKKYNLLTFILMFVVNIIIAFFTYGVTYKFETFTNDLFLKLIFDIIILLQFTYTAVSINKIRLNKDKNFIKHKKTLFSLFNKNISYSILESKYYESLENRLFDLLIKEYDKSSFSKENIIYMFRKNKADSFIQAWVERKNHSEFKKLHKQYVDNSSFFKIYSKYEKKDLNDLSNKENIRNLTLHFFITILTIVINIYTVISDHELLKRKVVGNIILLIIMSVVFSTIVYRQTLSKLKSEYFDDIIIISSATAKACRHK